MQNINLNSIGYVFAITMSLVLITVSGSTVKAEMSKMSDDELSEVSGQSEGVVNVHKQAKKLNLYEKLGVGPDELRGAVKDKLREKYSGRLSNELLEDNQITNQFMDMFISQTVKTMQTTGKPPVSVTSQGSLKLSGELSGALFKSAIKQSLRTMINPGEVIPGGASQ